MAKPKVYQSSVYARVIQVAYALFLLGLFYALVTDGIYMCIGSACNQLKERKL